MVRLLDSRAKVTIESGRQSFVEIGSFNHGWSSNRTPDGKATSGEWVDVRAFGNSRRVIGSLMRMSKLSLILVIVTRDSVYWIFLNVILMYKVS
jgi:hypothetical protein